MAKGRIVYTLDGSTPITYDFEVNYSYGYKPEFIDLQSRKRALDGTAYSDKPSGNKRSWSLSFFGAPLTQKEAFDAAYEGGYSVQLFLDSANPKTADVIFSDKPDVESQPYFRSGVFTWLIDVEFVEI